MCRGRHVPAPFGGTSGAGAQETARAPTRRLEGNNPRTEREKMTVATCQKDRESVVRHQDIGKQLTEGVAYVLRLRFALPGSVAAQNRQLLRQRQHNLVENVAASRQPTVRCVRLPLAETAQRAMLTLHLPALGSVRTVFTHRASIGSFRLPRWSLCNRVGFRPTAESGLRSLPSVLRDVVSLHGPGADAA